MLHFCNNYYVFSLQISLLLPLVKAGRLSLPGYYEPVIAANNFKLFVTQRSVSGVSHIMCSYLAFTVPISVLVYFYDVCVYPFQLTVFVFVYTLCVYIEVCA